jgi:hypothetical protein
VTLATTTRDAAVSKGLRIYQYTDQDGHVFWSFEKFPSIVTPSRVMTIGDRVGTHFDNYLSELRVLRRYILEKEKDATLGRG